MLYVVCSLGKDMLEPYDETIDYTPNLARFAEEGVVFERQVTEAGQSGIAFASILTGDQAMRHGVYAHPTRLRDAVETLPEAFARAGYDTFYWEHQSMASVELNYGQGVEPDHAFADRALVAEDPKFIAVLRRLAKDPSYKALIVSFDSSLMHAPYSRASVEEFCARHGEHCRDADPAKAEPFYRNWLALSYDFPEASQRLGLVGERLEGLVDAVNLIYESRVYYADQVFGGLLEAIERFGLADESLVAFTADHGETLYRDDSLFKWSHGFDLDSDVINVPLIVRAPALAPDRHRGVSRSVDIFPTLAALAGVEIDEGNAWMGRDLSKSHAGCQTSPKLLAFSHTGMWPPVGKKWWIRQPLLVAYHPENDPKRMWVSVRSGDLVIKHRADATGKLFYQAFDVASDPDEEHDIFDREDPRQRALVHQLDRYRETLVEGYFAPSETAPKASPSDEAKMIEQLRALGYIE